MTGLIKRDARLTVINIAHSVGIPSGPAHMISTRQLKLRKVCARCTPIVLLKKKKTTRMKMPIYSSKKLQNCNKSRISELLTVDGTWIYKFEPHRRVNNKQWLCKVQARHVIVNNKKLGGKFQMPYF